MAGPRLDAQGRELLDALYDKWSLLVLDVLCDGPCRFSGLRRELRPITSKSLTQTLRRLERNGVVSRHVVSTLPFAVEYAITPLGRTLERPMREMLSWVITHLPEVVDGQARFDEADVDPLETSSGAGGPDPEPGR